MRNLGGRPPYVWTDAKIAQLLAMWGDSVSIKTIAAEIGADKKTVSHKIKALGLRREPLARALSQDALSEPAWDDKLFESWADRKARLARERAS